MHLSCRAGSAPQVKRLLIIRILVHCVHHSQIVGAPHGVLRGKTKQMACIVSKAHQVASKGKTAQWL